MSFNLDISDIAETAFLTLYCHAIDAKTEDPILNDLSSIKVVQLLEKQILRSDNKLHRRLMEGKIDKSLVTHTAIRAKKYDTYAIDFIKKHPTATIVNVGCGLDNRFERVDNGEIRFFDLDLPEVIDIKKQIFGETVHYKFISQSVFDFSWISGIEKSDILFLAEGVFMYCLEEDVRSLLLRLQQEFPGSEIVCEVFNSIWIKAWLKKMVSYKMQMELCLGKEAVFHFGIRDSNEMESWNKGIQLVDDWSYFDSDEKKLGWLKVFRKIELFRKTQWTVHYKLNPPS